MHMCNMRQLSLQLGELTKLEEAEAKVRLGKARCTAAEQPTI